MKCFKRENKVARPQPKQISEGVTESGSKLSF
jgi:hypothetical protein